MKQFVKFEGVTRLIEQFQLRELIKLNQEESREFIFQSNGKICSSKSTFGQYQTVYVYSKLLGGKGGFGAKLKTEGGKKVRPNENIFSKDIQGRPIAYSAASKQYEEFIRKKLIEDQQVKKQMVDYKKVSNRYSKYHMQMQQNQERIKNAMKIGIKKYFCNIQEKNKKQKCSLQNQQEKLKEDEQNQQEKELVAIRRQKPISGKDQQQQKCEMAIKKIRRNQQVQINEKKVQKKDEVAIKFSSARQKLKSLFKK